MEDRINDKGAELSGGAWFYMSVYVVVKYFVLFSKTIGWRCFFCYSIHDSEPHCYGHPVN
jgi:hypothetical protein